MLRLAPYPLHGWVGWVVAWRCLHEVLRDSGAAFPLRELLPHKLEVRC